MFLDDVELLFIEFVDYVQSGATARGAGFGPKLVLFGFEVTGDRLASRGLRLLLG